METKPSGKVSNLTLPVACEKQANVQIRWLLTSNIAVSNTPILASGNGRIDEIVVIGDALPLCTVMSSINNGLWNDPNTWSCGRIPDINDIVTVGHNVVISGNGVCKNINYIN